MATRRNNAFYRALLIVVVVLAVFVVVPVVVPATPEAPTTSPDCGVALPEREIRASMRTALAPDSRVAGVSNVVLAVDR